MKKSNMIAVFLLLIVLVLEILPFGAGCNFAPVQGETMRQTFSYFSLVPFGYANFAPLITAILTCALLLLSGISLWKDAVGLQKTRCILSGIAALISFAPLLFGISYYSLLGLCISLLLLCATGVTVWQYKAGDNKKLKN